jgi:uncharacterized membrane protein
MDQQPVHIPRVTLDWLEGESIRWRDTGILDQAARDRILSGYDAEPPQNRGMIALILFAVTLCGVGLLLLIGYNWDRIPVTVKVSLLVGTVALAFMASAVAYARNHKTAGETLAFAGTLLFGNAIWLVAQVLHISGHFPDAFFWLAIGCLTCACLLRSTWIGVEAAVVTAMWIAAEGTFAAHPILPFAGLWGAGVWLAYRIGSPLMLRILAPGAALWVFLSTIDAAPTALAVGALTLAGCALYAAGRWHENDAPLDRAWKSSGLLVLLVALVPLMIPGAHRELHARNASAAAEVIVVLVAVTAAAGAVRRRPTPSDVAVMLATAVTVVWMFWAGASPSTVFIRSAVIAFSVVTLVMAVTLTRTAFRAGGTSDLVFGVLFGLAFLIVRWTSVLENLLWSGLLMLVAGGGLLVVARLWRQRDRSLVAAERAS